MDILKMSKFQKNYQILFSKKMHIFLVFNKLTINAHKVKNPIF